MTLIAVATYGDHAEILTDSLSYSANLSQIGQSGKVHPLTHLDAVVCTQGDVEFGAHVVAMLESQLADELGDTFADLVADAPAALAELYDAIGGHERRGDCFVVLVGPEDGSYVCRILSSHDGFTARRHRSVFCHPSPWLAKPSRVELQRFRAHRTSHDDQAAADTWAAMPLLAQPQGLEDWLRIARLCREHRAMGEYERVLVGGRIRLTHVGQGELVSTVVHEFDDVADIDRLTYGTLHPVSQAGPCWCGSGDRFRDCHLVAQLDTSCGCHSGKALADCCAIEAALTDA